jgi:hypothetical protein
MKYFGYFYDKKTAQQINAFYSSTAKSSFDDGARPDASACHL